MGGLLFNRRNWPGFQPSSTWIPHDAPVELAHSRRPAAAGIVSRGYVLVDDEICICDGMPCTTPARTAFDLGRHLDPQLGVIRIDSLLNATGTTASAVQAIAERHPRTRGVPRLRKALEFVDPGAESPQETVYVCFSSGRGFRVR